MLTAALIVFVVTAAIAYEWSIRSSRVWKMLRGQFPGVFSFPFIGNALQLGTTPEVTYDTLYELWKKLGRKSFTVVLGSDPYLMLAEAEDVKAILSSTTDVHKNAFHVKVHEEFFGDTVLVSTGEKHKVMRKIMMSSFQSRLLEQYLEISNKEADVLVHNLEGSAGGPAIDVLNPLRTYAVNMICGATLGIDCSKSDEGQKYLEASGKILLVMIKRQYSAIYRNDFLYKKSALHKQELKSKKAAYDIIDSIIVRIRKEFEKNIKPFLKGDETEIDTFISENRTKMTFIDVLLMSKFPDGSPVPDEEIRTEVNGLIFAGSEPQAVSVAFAMSNLAKYRHLQEKAYREQLEIFKDDPNRDPTITDISKMNYLKRFVKESMRIYPTAAQLARSIVVDTELPNGRIIPAGSNVIFYIHGLHMDPDQFPDPELFDPDRFLTPIPTYSYIPYGAGTRNCIAMNFSYTMILSILSKILRNYELVLERPDDEPRPFNQFVMTSKNGFKVQFLHRKKNYKSAARQIVT